MDSFNQQSEMLNLNQGEDSFGDFLIESQDVDMSLLGLDMLPWFDAPGGDLMPVFDNGEIDLRDTGDGLE